MKLPKMREDGRDDRRTSGLLRIRFVAPAVLAVAALLAAVASPDLVRVVGAVSLVAVAVVSLQDRAHRPFSGQVVLVAAATAVLAVSEAGVVSEVEVAETWKLTVALLAYPLLGRALLRQVRRYRLIRDADLVVEAVLIGAAAAIVLQVGIDWRGADPAASWHLTHGALPAVLVGLDVALGVIVVRSVGLREARRGPLGFLGVTVAALLTAHLMTALELAQGLVPSGSASFLVALALAAVGAAAVHTRSEDEPPLVTVEPPLFSSAHATLVAVAMMAAPVVLVVQSLRSITASATVAAGSLASGLLLASYLVGLLRERASSEHQATHDSLTGLPNRVLFMDRLERAVAHAERSGSPVGVLYIDLDGFKDVNDTLGHGAGDILLRATAERLTSCSRFEDTVARLGGDEFAVLLPHLAAADDVCMVAERMLAALVEPVKIGEHQIRNAASVGVSVYPQDGLTAGDLVVSADTAMYRAKDRGGNLYEVFSAEMSTTAYERLQTETTLFNAIQHDELVLHYQPIVDAVTGRIAGAEGLVRWQHPEKGLLAPGHFIPVAEQSDLIVVLGDWVLRDACRELARWAELGFGDRWVSVNVSARHFNHDLVSAVTAALRETGADPRNLVIELTESTAVDNIGAVADALHELRRIGVRAAIDDFGTGYCSLQYLGDLPVYALKIDRSFVQAMTPRSAAIVGATIAMGHSLGLTLVAEGVETEDQRRFLERSGCDRLQGYHLGRPMPVDELLERFAANRQQAPATPDLPLGFRPAESLAN